VSARSPLFLTVELTLQAHREMIVAYGGGDDMRDLGLIESAIAQGQSMYYYASGDLFAIAAAYAFHLAESQAFIDGNKRTRAAAALAFLELNDVDISRMDSHDVYEMMIRIATKELTKAGLADFLRNRLA
jgi:death-on-curing protein